MLYEYVPQLDNCFHVYWKNYGDITIHEIPISEIEDNLSKFPQNSFFDLLFNNSYIYDYYVTTFKEVSITFFQKKIRERLHCTGKLFKFYVSDIEADIDLYSIDTEQTQMLDLLLQYRLENNIDLSVIDYESLQSNLSKLIFIYLDFFVNDNYQNFNNINLISDENNTLETLFEIYVINEVHRIIKNTSYMLDTNIVSIRPEREKFIVTQEIINSKRIELNNILFDDTFYIFKNGVILLNSLFTLDLISGVQYYINWTEDDLFDVDDVIIIDYNVKVDPEDTGETGIDLQLNVEN